MAFYFVEYGSHYTWGCSLGLDPSLTSANGTLERVDLYLPGNMCSRPFQPFSAL